MASSLTQMCGNPRFQSLCILYGRALKNNVRRRGALRTLGCLSLMLIISGLPLFLQSVLRPRRRICQFPDQQRNAGKRGCPQDRMEMVPEHRSRPEHGNWIQIHRRNIQEGRLPARARRTDCKNKGSPEIISIKDKHPNVRSAPRLRTLFFRARP